MPAMNCPKCNAPLVDETIEGRRRERCTKCNYMKYDRRKVTDGYHSIVDDIADEVASKGMARSDWVVLINTAFSAGSSFHGHARGRTSEEQLKDWCAVHGFKYEAVRGNDANGKSTTWIHFTVAPR